MFDWLFSNKYDDVILNSDDSDNSPKNKICNVKYIIRNSDYEIYNDMFFNTQREACKYVNFMIKEKQAKTYSQYNVETYCVDSDDNSVELDSSDDILDYIDNHEIEIVMFKLYRKNNMLFRLTLQQFDDSYYVMPIREFVSFAEYESESSEDSEEFCE